MNAYSRLSGPPDGGKNWGVLALSVLIILFGLFFVIFGTELLWLGGSWYYLPCGLLLVAAGLLMMFGRVLGAWLYLAAWLLTIPWTIYEVGFSWWEWMPRLFGPTLIAIAVASSLPVLLRQERNA